MKSFSILKVAPDAWARDFSEAAHRACFNERSDPEDEHISFALIAIKDGAASAYLTAREVGGRALYLAYGGAFPPIAGTSAALPIYLEMIKACLELSDILMTYVVNTNISYLRMAMKAGFLITGIRHFRGTTLVELTLDREIK